MEIALADFLDQWGEVLNPHFSQTVYCANFYWCDVEKISSPRTIEQELRSEVHFLDQYYEHMSISGRFSEDETHLSH
jgi:hypothetical protein